VAIVNYDAPEFVEIYWIDVESDTLGENIESGKFAIGT
jgi:hypothetical protein